MRRGEKLIAGLREMMPEAVIAQSLLGYVE